MAEKYEDTKIGAGHASAMARMGLRELRGAIYPESNVAQQPEYGLYGTLTPGEVAESRRADEPQPVQSYDKGEERGSILSDRLADAQGRSEPDRDTKTMEKE